MKAIRKLFLLIIALSSFNISALNQSTSDISNLKLIKGEKELNLIFIYDSLRVGDYKEDAYIEKRVEEYSSKGEDRGELWRQEWHDNKQHYENEFTTSLNKKLSKYGVSFSENNKGAKYALIVHSTYIDIGWSAGLVSGVASVVIYIGLVNNTEPEKVLSEITASGFGDAGLDKNRIGFAYKSAGNAFAKYLKKNVY